MIQRQKPENCVLTRPNIYIFIVYIHVAKRYLELQSKFDINNTRKL